MRARSGKTVLRKRKRLRKLAKGYRAGRRTLYRQSAVTQMRAGVFAYRHRRQKKRLYRRLWITRITAACRMRGVRYSQFIAGLQRASVEVDRKMLSELAIHDPKAFDELVSISKPFFPEVTAKAS
jgi:large subunit ribosomal protein L20